MRKSAIDKKWSNAFRNLDLNYIDGMDRTIKDIKKYRSLKVKFPDYKHIIISMKGDLP
jgi:hypothetical protein